MTFLHYLRRNKRLAAGLGILLFLFLFATVGRLIAPPENAYPLAVAANKPPSWEYPFGTDSQGRDLLATAVMGTYLTARIGFFAGLIGVFVGTVLGFTAAYFGGVVDVVIRYIVDVLLTVPGLLVLVVVAASMQRTMDPAGMSLILAMLAWMGPARSIRAQVLSMRERAFVSVAKLSGMNDFEIIFKELVPNLLPFLGASLVAAVTGAIFASLGLEQLGLGPMREPTLGMTIFWVQYYGAFVRGMWWWILSPISVIVLLFMGLFLLSAGLDEFANPRVRRVV